MSLLNTCINPPLYSHCRRHHDILDHGSFAWKRVTTENNLNLLRIASLQRYYLQWPLWYVAESRVLLFSWEAQDNTESPKFALDCFGARTIPSGRTFTQRQNESLLSTPDTNLEKNWFATDVFCFPRLGACRLYFSCRQMQLGAYGRVSLVGTWYLVCTKSTAGRK